MLVKNWDKLPKELQLDEVKPYWTVLRKRNINLLFKRSFDVVVSGVSLVLLSPLFLVLAITIKLDSKGPVFYRQERITQYNRYFKIHKFRSMCNDADKKGTLVTIKGDNRVTKVGKFIRKCKLDELSQLIDVFQGTMSFVGTRPEVRKYVDAYTPEMMATLLLPAGITSMASIKYKDENDLLDGASDVDKVYIEQVLPEKMKYNLQELKKEGLFHDIKVIFQTLFSIFC